MIRVCDPLAFHHPIPPWNTHMSLQLQFFFFRVSLGCLLFQWGIPFFMGFARYRVRPRSGCYRVGGFGGGPPARPPATHAAMRHAQPVRAGVVPFFISFLLFISVPPFCSRR